MNLREGSSMQGNRNVRVLRQECPSRNSKEGRGWSRGCQGESTGIEGRELCVDRITLVRLLVLSRGDRRQREEGTLILFYPHF